MKFKIIWQTHAISQHKSLFFSGGKKQEHIFLCYCEHLLLSASELCLIYKVCNDSGLEWKKSWWVGGGWKWGGPVAFKMHWIVCAVLINQNNPILVQKSFMSWSCLCFQMNVLLFCSKSVLTKGTVEVPVSAYIICWLSKYREWFLFFFFHSPRVLLFNGRVN